MSRYASISFLSCVIGFALYYLAFLLFFPQLEGSENEIQNILKTLADWNLLFDFNWINKN